MCVKSSFFQDVSNALKSGGCVLVPKAQVACRAFWYQNGSVSAYFRLVEVFSCRGVKRAVFVPCQPMRHGGRKRGVWLSGLNNRQSEGSVVSEE